MESSCLNVGQIDAMVRVAETIATAVLVIAVAVNHSLLKDLHRTVKRNGNGQGPSDTDH